jgi:hypothetical protein
MLQERQDKCKSCQSFGVTAVMQLKHFCVTLSRNGVVLTVELSGLNRGLAALKKVPMMCVKRMRAGSGAI